MTDRIVTLRDNSNNKVYPVGFAPAGAVTTSMYTDASITTPKLADGSVTTSKLANNSVTTDKISPGAIVDGIQTSSITEDKIDWTTLPVTTNVAKYPNGEMRVSRVFTGTVTTSSTLFGMKAGALPAFSFEETFVEPPVVSVTAFPTSSTSFFLSGYEYGEITTTEIKAGTFCLVRSDQRDVAYEVHVTAYGKWK